MPPVIYRHPPNYKEQLNPITTMNVKHFMLAALAGAFALTSCSDEDAGFHSTYFYPSQVGGKKIYADQTIDSVRVISYDSWTLKKEGDWMTKVTPESLEVPPGYASSQRLDFTFEPNTTGASRTGAIYVTSAYEKIGTIFLRITQYPYLNIASPSGVQGEDNRPDYNLQIKGTTEKISDLAFTTYAPLASLQSTVDWMKPDSSAFKPGYHANVSVTVEPNPGEPRKGRLILTSAGVSDTINVTQLKK